MPDVEVEIVNKSSRDLKDAEVVFGEYVCHWGIAVRTASKSYMYYPHPITTDAVLRWQEEERDQRTERLDLRQIYPARAVGRLTFVVLDEGAKASFRSK
jgi:hypothetical protein